MENKLSELYKPASFDLKENKHNMNIYFRYFSRCIL